MDGRSRLTSIADPHKGRGSKNAKAQVDTLRFSKRFPGSKKASIKRGPGWLFVNIHSICLHIYTHNMYIYVYAYLCIYVYVYMHVCMHVCLYVYMRMNKMPCQESRGARLKQSPTYERIVRFLAGYFGVEPIRPEAELSPLRRGQHGLTKEYD